VLLNFSQKQSDTIEYVAYTSTPFQVKLVLKTLVLQRLVLVSGFQNVSSLVFVGWEPKALINGRLLVVTNALTTKGCETPFLEIMTVTRMQL